VASKDKVYEAVEKLAQTSRDSYETVIDHAVALGERNVKFVRGVFDTTISEYRQQGEANMAVTQELVERAEKQGDAFRTVVEEWFDTYRDVFYAPLNHYKEANRKAKAAS
jgi:hydroxypyruvate isomerase